MNGSAEVTLPGITFGATDFGLHTLLKPKSRKSLFPAPPPDITMPTPDANRLSPVTTPPVEEGTGAQQAQEESAHMLAPTTADVQAVPQVTLSSAEQDRLSVQAALQGDQGAFGDLVTRYQSAVYNMAYRMLGNPTDAEDAAQEVFVRAWNQLHTFQLDRRFSTWLLSIASHHCIDVLRRRKPSAPLDGVALYVQSNEPAPIERVMQSEQRDTVRALLNTLPDKYRSVTVLRYYNDLSYEEIARVTGLTESAVKTQLHRARRMLADKMLEERQK
jgi:RNA polymerase sigma-70 factor (ECF subfamily)